MIQLRIADQAKADLMDIWSYIAQDNEQAADILSDRIADKFEQLLTLPGMGRERRDIGPGLRSFLQESYVIFYRLIDDGIEIVRVLHGARDIENLF